MSEVDSGAGAQIRITLQVAWRGRSSPWAARRSSSIGIRSGSWN
jgi:hypothetical protein